MKKWIALLLVFAALGVNASFLEIFGFQDINRRLKEEHRDLQGAFCSTILRSFAYFEGCTCELKVLRNLAEVKCDNKCQGCSSTEDVCVVGSFDLFISVTSAELQKVVLRVDHSGADSSQSSMKLELIDGATPSCNTFVNDAQCTSCTLGTTSIDLFGNCIAAVHDCRNLGFGRVNGCNFAALEAVPSENPFSVLTSDVLFPLENCLYQNGPVLPVPAPVPTPQSPAIPPKKTLPMDKEKDQLKLSNFDAGRGGIKRKLKSIRGK